MQIQLGVTSTSPPPAVPLPVGPEAFADLLRQILDVQKEHLHHVRTASQESMARWRNLLGRWQEEHPEFSAQCKKAYPAMERVYVSLLVNMVTELAQAEGDAFESEFAVAEFLDRYGMRVAQLGQLISIVGPLAEAANQNEAKPQG